MSTENKKTILLVEDEVITAMLEKQQLEKYGYTVHHITTGEKAVSTITEDNFQIDLILMDIDLGPGIDGTRAAEQILSHKDIPVVFLSSHTEPDVVEKTERITSYGYVVKNSGIVVLDASIKMALKLFNEKIERMLAEEAVLRTEENYRFQFLNMNSYNSLYEVVADKDGVPYDFRFVMVNYAYEEYVGKKASELIGKTLLEVYPKTEQCWIDKMAEAVLTGVPVYFRNFSQEMNTYTEVNLYIPQKGQLAMTTANIKERKQAEEALQESEQTFRKLFEDSADAILLIDKTGVFVECNQAALTLLKMSREQFLFKPPVDISPEYQADGQKSREKAIKMIEIAYEKGLHRFDWTCINSEKDEFIVEVSLMPIKVRGELMLHTTWRDITGRKHAEEALRESELLFSQMFEQSIVSTQLLDIEGNTIRVNSTFCKLFGVTTEDMMHYKIFEDDAIKESDAYEPLMDVFENKISRRWYNQFNIAHASESSGVKTTRPEIVFLENLSYPILDKENNLQYVVIQHFDITERKQAEEEIKKQLSEKETLLREVHHRIKNNMTNVEGLLFMQADSIDNPEAKAAILESLTRVKSIRILYDKLLLGKEYHDISIKSYVEGLLDAISSVYVTGNEIIIQKQITDFIIDSKKAISLGIIINELLTNVFKYAFEGCENGNVLISIERTENEAILIIQDNGIGIDERILENKSPGFGLTIVKMLVEQLKGTYSIENDNGAKSVIKFEI